MAEKKTFTIPSTWCEEQLRKDAEQLAEFEQMTLADVTRKALSEYVDKHMVMYMGLHSIFAGRERRSNKNHALERNDNGVAESWVTE